MSWSQTGPVKETSYSLDHECGGQTDVRVITDPKWETPVVVESYLGQQPPLGDAELEDMHKRFGAKIHAFAIKRRGSVIGDGECWTLANEALKHSGARVALGHNYGQEVGGGGGHTSGWHCFDARALQIERAKARKGDLIYFQHCRFEGSVPVSGGGLCLGRESLLTVHWYRPGRHVLEDDWRPGACGHH